MKLYNIDTLVNDYIHILRRLLNHLIQGYKPSFPIYPKKLVDIHFSRRTKCTNSGETFVTRSYFRLKLSDKKVCDIRS